jgi:hypothetical protein
LLLGKFCELNPAAKTSKPDISHEGFSSAPTFAITSSAASALSHWITSMFSAFKRSVRISRWNWSSSTNNDGETKWKRPPTEVGLGPTQSPHAIAAPAFVHAERLILGRIKRSSNEPRFFAALATTWRLWLEGGVRIFHFLILAPAHEQTLFRDRVAVCPVTGSAREPWMGRRR